VRLGPNDYFGERSLLTEEPRAADVTAMTHVECITISREVLDDALTDDMMASHILQHTNTHTHTRCRDIPSLSSSRPLLISTHDDASVTFLLYRCSPRCLAR
jgi:CRP-like cAMP-binding protein